MKKIIIILVLILVFALTVPALAGNGPGGPGGHANTPTPTPTGVPQPTSTPTGVPQPTPTPGGGSGSTPNTGELYGDLYVILRDEDGLPILSTDGCIQPISTVTASTTIATLAGDLVINVVEGEPFGLPTYTDTAGDLVECELTETMATWVQSVDFGRLNLGRAPEAVIAHAFDEAINKMNVAIAMYLDPAGRLVLTVPDDEDPTLYVDKTIDAPAENLALYIEMMTDGDWFTENTTPIVKGGLPTGKGPPEGDGPSAEPRPVLNTNAIGYLIALGFEHLGVPNDGTGAVDLNNPELLLAASLLAAAADKTGSINLDKVIYINFIYGINQLGTLPGEIEGKTYFDFSAFEYGNTDNTGRSAVFGNRSSGACALGWIWVLQPELDTTGVEVPDHFVTQCMEILGYENSDHASTINAVRFTDMVEGYTSVPYTYDFVDNVRGFSQAADDALQVIEYIHNYKVPEVLYP